MAIVKLIIAFFLSFFQLITPIGKTVLRVVSGTQFEKWSMEQEFTGDYAETLEKKPGKDFVILNITDVQLNDGIVYGEDGNIARAMIDRLVEETQPDLITMTGDNATGTLAYADIVKVLDSYGIPWAPVMGNHDGQGTIGEWYCAGLMMEANNCLWKNGPEDMGWGNYILNITENGEIVHTLFMMDTHSDNKFELEDGQVLSGYDHLWENQLDWYAWGVKGVEALAGKPVESTVFFHIPLFESMEGYEIAYDKELGAYVEPYAATAFGINHESVCCAPVKNAMFSLALALGSTKTFIYGHDHINCSSFEFEGIRLSYGLKTGFGSYSENEMNGGTTITIGSDGAATVEHHFIDYRTLDY